MDCNWACCFEVNSLTSTKRLNHLEAARGIASIIVVFHHFALGFFPLIKSPVAQGGFLGTPLYIIVNGNGAVVFFFVLSGFVLTHKFFQRFLIQELATSVLKRLPRLLLPAGLSMMIGAVVLIYFSEAHSDAAQLTGSRWLAEFADTEFSENFVPSFLDAAKKSFLVFVQPSHVQYNSVLWTMLYEFYGSFLVFALVAISSLRFRQELYGVIVLHVYCAVLCLSVLPLLFLPFVIGSLIAYLHCKRSVLFSLHPWVVATLVLTMIAGYSVNHLYAQLIASTAAMILLLGVSFIEKWLSSPMGLFLGRLSFPLYLVHVLIILSLTSAAYATLTGFGVPRLAVLLVCFVLTWAGSLLAALPFMAIERFWIHALNRWSRALVWRFLR